jgi:hypothetical protein
VANGRAARPYLVSARFLFDRLAERYVAAALTRPGRAWRRCQVQQSAYTRAFDHAACYLQRLDEDPESSHYLPELFLRSGALPLFNLRIPVTHRAPTAD